MTEQQRPADTRAQPATDKLQALHQRLCVLNETGAQRFDPVRWQLIDTLIRRAHAQPPEAAATIITKAAEILDRLDSTFSGARAHADDTLSRIQNRFPAHATTAQQLLTAGDFKPLKRLEQTLRGSERQQLLQTLNTQLNQAASTVDSDSTSFSANLQQQDDDSNFSTLRHGGGEPERANIIASGKLYPLKAALWAQRHQHRHQARQLIHQAGANCPANSGPLHPQRLIVNALTSTSDISCHYLNRMLAQWQTLLTLEQTSAALGANRTGKKAAQ